MLSLPSKSERLELLNAVCLLSGSICNLQGTEEQRSTFEYSLKSRQIKFVLFIESSSSVRNNPDEIVLKIFVFAFGRILQFSTCHDIVKVSERHQMSESSFQWCDTVKKYVSRAVEKFVLTPPLHILLELFSDFVKVFLNFQLDRCAL